MYIIQEQHNLHDLLSVYLKEIKTYISMQQMYAMHNMNE